MQRSAVMTSPWSIVVPVKRIAQAKTRLAPFAGDLRHQLALAFACDTIAAALAGQAVGAVIVVTDDPDAARAIAELGARVVPDVPNAGLNPAVEYGVAAARAHQAGHSVAALSADLPALRTDELDAALAVADRHPRSFVADAASEGTTLLTAGTGVLLRPAFGPHSARAHRASGAYEITAAGLESLRLDVDTEHDLRRAHIIGLGPRSAAVAATLAGVQGTVRRFEPDTGTGTVLLDDGTELPFDAAAFGASGLRLVRSGQRVRIAVDGSGAGRRVTFLTLATL